MDVVDQILARAEALGLTQQELEERAGLTQGRLSKWKKGVGQPYFGQVASMARVVGVSLDELAGRAPPGPATPDELLLWKVVSRIGADAAFAILMDALPRPPAASPAEPAPPPAPGRVARDVQVGPAPPARPKGRKSG